MGETPAVDIQRVRGDLLAAHRAAIAAVGGRASVAGWLQRNACTATHVVAIGKAAAAMAAGALEVLGNQVAAALVITKTGHGAEIAGHDRRLHCIESSHPLADARSLEAGRALIAFFDAAPAAAQFLVCISGGASSLVEQLDDSLDAAFLSRVNAWLLSGGLAIDDMNRIRKRLSTIKGGRLASRVRGRALTCLMISDVPGDDPRTIGSGLLIEHRWPDLDVSHLDLPGWLAEAAARAPALAPPQAFAGMHTALVARPRDACAAAVDSLQRRGYRVRPHDELLQGDALAAGACLVEEARESPGLVHIRSSETTVVLPDNPGRGGRCQALALAAAQQIREGETMVLLAAGTDGTDGPGDVAGALIDGGSCARGRAAGLDPQICLAAADAGGFLEASGDLLRTGPTGTNVMDVILSWHAEDLPGS